MLPFKEGQNILEIGGGERPTFRPNMDIRSSPAVDIVADLNNPFPIKDATYDGVYSSYLLEHISWRKVSAFIGEIFRVLKPGGKVFLVTANLQEQCKVLAEKKEWGPEDVCMLFGDQNYTGEEWRANAHYCGFSPQYAIKMFVEAGFRDVITSPHPNCPTDLLIEATRPKEEEKVLAPSAWTKADRKIAYGRDYFDGGKGGFGGYAHEGYWDYPVHWLVLQKILERKPASVLEIGAARGYIIKRIEDRGIPATGMEVSDHCLQTRVSDNVIEWDATETPWPFPDNSYDLCFSMAVMEHIPESKLAAMFSEMNRICKRSLHAISFEDDAFDKTHVTLKPKVWWDSVAGDPKHEIIDKEEFVKGVIPLPPADGKVKLNIGSFTLMFHSGWLNMDLHPLQKYADRYGYRFQQHDMRTPLPFENGTVDMMFMHHFLEHLTYAEGDRFLDECSRVMKPGGLIRIVLPDAARLLQDYTEGKLGQYDVLNSTCAKAETQIERLWELIFAGHSSMYDRKKLLAALSRGFGNAYLSGFRSSSSMQMLRETIDIFPTLSLFVEAVK